MTDSRMNQTSQQKKSEIPLLGAVRDFVKLESAGGILLLSSAIIALLVANSGLSGAYAALLTRDC